MAKGQPNSKLIWLRFQELWGYRKIHLPGSNACAASPSEALPPRDHLDAMNGTGEKPAAGGREC